MSSLSSRRTMGQRWRSLGHFSFFFFLHYQPDFEGNGMALNYVSYYKMASLYIIDQNPVSPSHLVFILGARRYI